MNTMCRWKPLVKIVPRTNNNRVKNIICFSTLFSRNNAFEFSNWYRRLLISSTVFSMIGACLPHSTSIIKKLKFKNNICVNEWHESEGEIFEVEIRSSKEDLRVRQRQTEKQREREQERARERRWNYPFHEMAS